MEDIINRGGGNVVIQVWQAGEDNRPWNEAFHLSISGIRISVRPGEIIRIEPGESICLPPRTFHQFWGEEGSGSSMSGEVSSVCEDRTDNYFHGCARALPRHRGGRVPHPPPLQRVPVRQAQSRPEEQVDGRPDYLKGYEAKYAIDPRAAGDPMVQGCAYGLFLHYGLYSILARHEWVQFLEKIPVAEYEKLIDQFTAEGFDADHIADFALDCGMRYINITTRHHESFCLWDTKQTPFNSMNAPAHRDLVEELADACRKRRLGLFFYYSHGRTGGIPTARTMTNGRKAAPGIRPPTPHMRMGRRTTCGSTLTSWPRRSGNCSPTTARSRGFGWMGWRSEVRRSHAVQGRRAL